MGEIIIALRGQKIRCLTNRWQISKYSQWMHQDKRNRNNLANPWHRKASCNTVTQVLWYSNRRCKNRCKIRRLIIVFTVWTTIIPWMKAREIPCRTRRKPVWGPYRKNRKIISIIDHTIKKKYWKEIHVYIEITIQWTKRSKWLPHLLWWTQLQLN